MPFQPGFDAAEAVVLLGMMEQLGGPSGPPFGPVPFPNGWKSLFQSPSVGIFDNMWELFHDESAPGGRYAIVVRGTVVKAGSILDDLLSVMVPATGTALGRAYRFAAGAGCGVHLGFALAALTLLWDPDIGILAKLAEFCPEGSEIYIAGHSQGAAVASLVRAYLKSASPQPDVGHQYKTYVAALPRPGNYQFAAEFNATFSNGGMAHCLCNSQDWVPQVPLALEWVGDVSTPNPISVYLSHQILMAPMDEALKLLKDGLAVAQRVKHRADIQELGRRLHAPPAPTAAFGLHLNTAWDVPTILHSLDFHACGRPFVLLGTAGKNPCDPSDMFWQHHVAMYYVLLQGLPVPATCPPPVAGP